MSENNLVPENCVSAISMIEPVATGDRFQGVLAAGGRRALALSIRLKLFVLISAVVTGLVAFLVAYFASRQVALLERIVVEKGNFVARQLRTAVAFDDKETAREVFEAAHLAPEVLHLALFRADGRLLYADGNGELRAPAEAPESRFEARGDRLRVVAPVTSVEGPRGTLVIELDKAHLDADIRAVRRGAVAIGAVGLLLACLAAWAVGGSFSRRLGRVHRGAVAVAAGRLGEDAIDDGANDEIGQLATAFNVMVASLRTLVLKLSETSAQLEGASETFVDIVRAESEDLTSASAPVEELLRPGAPRERLGDAAVAIERLIQSTKGLGDGLVPGFVELRRYAEHLNQVIIGFEVTTSSVPTEGRS